MQGKQGKGEIVGNTPLSDTGSVAQQEKKKKSLIEEGTVINVQSVRPGLQSKG